MLLKHGTLLILAYARSNRRMPADKRKLEAYFMRYAHRYLAPIIARQWAIASYARQYAEPSLTMCPACGNTEVL